MPFLSDFFGSLFGPQVANASAMSSSPDMAGFLGASDPGARPGALAGGMGPGGGLYGGSPMSGRAHLSQEEQLSEYLRELKEAQRREQMMNMLSMVKGTGQPPPLAPPAASPPLGGGRPGFTGGATNPCQQVPAMLGKAGGIGKAGTLLAHTSAGWSARVGAAFSQMSLVPGGWAGSGGWTRTNDLRLMKPPL